jgi:hypothetical protein
MLHHRLRKVNSPQLFVVSERVTRHLKLAMSQRVIQIFREILSLQGNFIHFLAENRWGSMSYLDLTQEDLDAAQKEIDRPQTKLGQWVLTFQTPLLP